MIRSPRARRRQVRAYLLGAGSVLAVELVVLGVALAPPPTVAVAGSAAPAVTQEARPRAAQPAETPSTTSKGPSPSRTPPPATKQSPEPAPPSTRDRPVSGGQRPGTIQLPEGGTATLVREEVGADAVLPVPESLDEATWWGAGLNAPSGASVFAGHVNWNGRTGPFAELWSVDVNERVTVVDAAGKVWTYRVTQIITLHKDELPARAPELFGQSGAHRVVLVTCGGRWLGGTTGYADNRVVIAQPA